MNCRIGCGACCIAPSISSPIPGMPEGKPAGIRCMQLSSDNKCNIFGLATRPKVCESLMPTNEICGNNTQEALDFWETLESITKS